MAKSPQGFIVVLPGEIIEIAQDDDSIGVVKPFMPPKTLNISVRVAGQINTHSLRHLDPRSL